MVFVRVLRRPVATAAMLFLALGVAGCAGLGPGKADDPSQVLTQRAQARWQALIEGDFAKAYGFETPAYRQATPLRLYTSRFGSQLRWDKAEVMEVLPDPDGETAVVRVMIFYTAMDAVGGVINGERPVDESWVRTGGDWWHIDK